MPCPSRNFKTQESSIRSIEDTEGLLAIFRADSLNVNKSPFYVLRSAVRHVLTLKSPNLFRSTICPTRKLVSSTLNDPDEEICDEEICKLPIMRLPTPNNPQMPGTNKLN